MFNPLSHSGAPALLISDHFNMWVGLSLLNFRQSFPNYLAQGPCKTAGYLHPVIEITSLLLPLGALPILFTPDPRVLNIC